MVVVLFRPKRQRWFSVAARAGCFYRCPIFPDAAADVYMLFGFSGMGTEWVAFCCCVYGVYH